MQALEGARCSKGQMRSTSHQIAMSVRFMRLLFGRPGLGGGRLKKTAPSDLNVEATTVSRSGPISPELEEFIALVGGATVTWPPGINSDQENNRNC